MPSPPLTIAEVNKFTMACKQNDMPTVEKYYQKMLRHNPDEADYINAAREGIEWMVVHNQQEMFDKLLLLCQRGEASQRYLFHIVLSALGGQSWALPKIEQLTQDVRFYGNPLQRCVFMPKDDATVQWVARHSQQRDIDNVHREAMEHHNWTLIVQLKKFVDEDRQHHALVMALADNAPDKIVHELQHGCTREMAIQALEYLNDNHRRIDDQTFKRTWNRIEEVFAQQQAVRISQQLEASDNVSLRRKI